MYAGRPLPDDSGDVESFVLDDMAILQTGGKGRVKVRLYLIVGWGLRGDHIILFGIGTGKLRKAERVRRQKRSN